MDAAVRPNVPRRCFRGAFHPLTRGSILFVISVDHYHRRDLPGKLCLGKFYHSSLASIDFGETFDSDENLERSDLTLCLLTPNLHKLLLSNQSLSFLSDSPPLKGRRFRSHPRALLSHLRLVPLLLNSMLPVNPIQVSNLLGPQPSRSNVVKLIHLRPPTLVHSPDRLLILTVTSSQSTASIIAPSMARDWVAEEPLPSPRAVRSCQIYINGKEARVATLGGEARQQKLRRLDEQVPPQIPTGSLAHRRGQHWRSRISSSPLHLVKKHDCWAWPISSLLSWSPLGPLIYKAILGL
ncbi:unnamed protein product [Arabis nemorensis]|uniref:Uncharacterized protein n=1 Tax=Arabis nemorensis TaxID=586526 RepID=A0A565CQ34_9BRAS|nr:unnamed protein product [Arabis nemorensis]